MDSSNPSSSGENDEEAMTVTTAGSQQQEENILPIRDEPTSPPQTSLAIVSFPVSRSTQEREEHNLPIEDPEDSDNQSVEPPSPLECCSCFVLEHPKNRIESILSSEFIDWRSIEFVVDNKLHHPVQDAIARVQSRRRTPTSQAQSDPSTTSPSEPSSLNFCKTCQRDYKKILAFQSAASRNVRDLRKLEKASKAAQNSLGRRRSRNSTGTSTYPVARKCRLASLGSINCSEGTRYRPKRLSLRHPAKMVPSWIPLFAKRASISIDESSTVWSDREKIFLCPAHTAAMYAVLKEVDKMETCCSVCGFSQTSSSSRRVTAFNWNKLSTHPGTACVIEDCLAVLTENKLRPPDIRRLCCACRRVICRPIDSTEAIPIPRDEKAAERADSTFDHGPTYRTVRLTIRFVRDKLWKDESRLVLFFSDVRQFYDSKVSELGEQMVWLKDDRSLKKYLLPSLASTGIYLELGARRVGAFFCTIESFKKLAATAKQPKHEDIFFQTGEKCKLLDSYESYLKRNKILIESFQWELPTFIRMVPRKLWLDVTLEADPKWLLRRGRATAKLCKQSFDLEWPCNPSECPGDIQSLPSHERTFVLTTYRMIEERVFVRSGRTVQGPLTAALTVVSSSECSVPLMTMLNRFGITASYNYVYGKRQDVIRQREERGPFKSLASGAFVMVGIDNINVRAKASLAVHGSTYHGFDGLAMQATNSDENFNFLEYCRNSSPEDNLPLRAPLIRNTFIEETFPLPSDPDITGYRYLVVGLAVRYRDRIAGRDPALQRSLRRIIMDGLKGFSNGKARVEYVNIRHCNPSSRHEVNRLLRQIGEYFNPPGTTEFVQVGVEGDQIIYKVVVEQFLESWAKWQKDPNCGETLCLWLVPIPGYWHIDKQGLIPLIKSYMRGSAIEQLLPFSGLSPRHQARFHQLAQYRMNRRFLSQVTAAMILRTESVVRNRDPNLSRQIKELLATVDKEESSSPQQKRVRFESTEREETIKQCLPAGCQLAVTTGTNLGQSCLQIVGESQC